jgi:hypothetical protein
LVSDGQWEAADGPAQEITYAHPVPDIPGAEVIWGARVFGKVELSRSFSADVLRAATEAETALPTERVPARRKMDYHAFLQRVAALETEREAILRQLMPASLSGIPVYKGAAGRAPSFSLGKAGILEEASTAPVARDVSEWAERLNTEDRRLIYPDARQLRGEAAANPAGEAIEAGEGRAGDRRERYQRPGDRATSPDGKGRTGAKGDAGSGGGVAGQTAAGGSPWLGGRGTRFGLLIPTLAGALYIAYLMQHLRTFTSD